MGLGFIHGVMNTDNCAISGETIDFGPCAFMEQFHPDCVYSSIDRYGRYSWGNQAQIILWNLRRFAETLLPLIDDNMDRAVDRAERSLESFAPLFHRDFVDIFSRKLGLACDRRKADLFIQTTLEKLSNHELDFTLFFRHLTRVAAGADPADFVALWKKASDVQQWMQEWRTVAQPEVNLTSMRKSNPVLIPRNHQVERAIQAGYEGDFSVFNRLVDALAQPMSINLTLQTLKHPPDQRSVSWKRFAEPDWSKLIAAKDLLVRLWLFVLTLFRLVISDHLPDL